MTRKYVGMEEARKAWLTYIATHEGPYFFGEYGERRSSPWEKDLNVPFNVWEKLMYEFCPIELWSRKWFNLPKRISELDDNTDYVWMWGNAAAPPDQPALKFIFRISSEPIAVMLRLAAE